MNAYTDDRPFSIDLAAAVSAPYERPNEDLSHVGFSRSSDKANSSTLWMP